MARSPALIVEAADSGGEARAELLSFRSDRVRIARLHDTA